MAKKADTSFNFGANRVSFSGKARGKMRSGGKRTAGKLTSRKKGGGS